MKEAEELKSILDRIYINPLVKKSIYDLIETVNVVAIERDELKEKLKKASKN